MNCQVLSYFSNGKFRTITITENLLFYKRQPQRKIRRLSIQQRLSIAKESGIPNW